VIPAARFVSQDDLASWRRKLPRGWQRAAAEGRRRRRPDAERVGEDAAAFTVAVPRPLPPEQAHEQVYRQVLGNARKSREDFQATVRQLRKWTPSLISHLTDEQAAEMLETEYGRRVEESVRRVYHRQGRAHELAIRIP